MSDLKIQLNDDRTAFEPGEEVAGTVSWRFDSAPRAVQLRLFWFTRGKGSEDAGLAENVRFDQALPVETRSFRVTLPEGPYSFSGQLISLVWALELVVEPSKASTRTEIVVGPGGREVRLERVPDSGANKVRFAWRTQ